MADTSVLTGAPFPADNPNLELWSVKAGRYTGAPRAQQAAEVLLAHGLEAFYYPLSTGRQPETDQKRPVEYELAAGLFGLKASAATLAERLRAQGLLDEGQTGLVKITAAKAAPLLAAQSSRLYERAQAVLNQAQQDAAQPTAPEAADGRAFKKVVYGRYIGSYRDRKQAEDEARSLTLAGWPASVASSAIYGEQWHRVYLTPSQDHKEWQANPNTLKRALSGQANRPGLLIIVDVSGMPDAARLTRPRADRRNASSCAGYSQFGLPGTILKRLSIHIPTGAYQVALREVSRRPESLPAKLIESARQRAWASSPDTRLLYGLSIYDHQAFMAALGRLDPQPKPASLAEAVKRAADDLTGSPGPKTVLIFSNFHPGGLKGLAEAAARLDAAKVVTVYSDPGGAGYSWASQLPKGGGEAWEACRLMADSAYYERFVKSLWGR